MDNSTRIEALPEQYRLIDQLLERIAHIPAELNVAHLLLRVIVENVNLSIFHHLSVAEIERLHTLLINALKHPEDVYTMHAALQYLISCAVFPLGWNKAKPIDNK